MTDPGTPSDELIDLVDRYCSNLIDEHELERFEAVLLEDEGARRYFVEYFHHHTEIQFAVRASQGGRRDSGTALRAGSAIAVRCRSSADLGFAGGRRDWLVGLVAAVFMIATVAGLSRLNRLSGPPNLGVATDPIPQASNIAWLVNAQDCLWAGTEQTPGRDMRAGKTLRLERGLAEIEFEKGARVILQGPAGIELVSGSCARLFHGTLTARVSKGAIGFTVLSPGGKVVDLGTEFGLSVDERGATTVRVFAGEVEAFSTGRRSSGRPGRDDPPEPNRPNRRPHRRTPIDRPGKGRRSQYVRAIVPTPVVKPRSLHLDFSQPTDVGIRDINGQGTRPDTPAPANGLGSSSVRFQPSTSNRPQRTRAHNDPERPQHSGPHLNR